MAACPSAAPAVADVGGCTWSPPRTLSVCGFSVVFWPPTKSGGLPMDLGEAGLNGIAKPGFPTVPMQADPDRP